MAEAGEAGAIPLSGLGWNFRKVLMVAVFPRLWCSFHAAEKDSGCVLIDVNLG